MILDPSIFRAYDIRGVAGETLTEETVAQIGQAIGSAAIAAGKNKLVIGRDGRLSGPVLSEALAKGITKSGCDVIDIGAIPSPVLYFATCVLDTDSGVMLTGSHNPAQDNGLKIVINGEALVNEEIKALYDRVINNDLENGHGTITEIDIREQYLDRICNDVTLAKPLKIVIDCGNGIGGALAPQLFRRLGCDVTELFSTVDGHFPNHHPDPSVPKNLQDLITKVKEIGADVGLAFDGDADRLGVVTSRGEIIWPDRYLIIFAIDMLSRHPGAMVLYDVKCTRFVASEVSKHGGEPMMWKTGHSYMKEKMNETGALLGGEMSGHTFFEESWYGFDDGLYSGARLLEILSKAESPQAPFDALPTSVNTPELKLPMADDKKFEFMDQFTADAKFADGKRTTIDGLRVDFADGFGLMRPSNTTPTLVFRFEADNEAALKRIQSLFREELLKLDSALELPF